MKKNKSPHVAVAEKVQKRIRALTSQWPRKCRKINGK
jgi:hypothetical protein